MPNKQENQQARAEKVNALLKQIETGTQEVFTSERYLHFLRTMSKFHQYSYRNCMLIAMQKPDATHVAGFQTWQKKFKRTVIRGQKGIQILGYTPYKKEVEVEMKDADGRIIYGKDGNPIMIIEEHLIPHYRPVYVFDVSQTYGEPLPEIGAELTGLVQNYADLIPILQHISPFPILFDDLNSHSPDTHGYCDFLMQEIHVRQGMSEVQTVKTVIHELAHAVLHAPERDLPSEKRADRATREVQAESVAFVVCNHLDVDTSDYTFDYLASWSSSHELKELQASLTVIQKQACQLIDAIDNELEKLREQQLSQALDEKYQAVELFEQPALFTNGRVNPDILPDGLYLYDLRGSDDDPGIPVTIESAVTVNHAGSVITAAPLEIPEQGFLCLGNGLNFADGELSIREYQHCSEQVLMRAAEPRFGIYQLRAAEENAMLRFTGMDYLEEQNLTVDGANYEFIYGDTLAENDTLDTIYTRFSLHHPEDYSGHSLSVSDVIVLHQNGKSEAHFVDSIGFTELPDFVSEREKILNYKIPEQNYQPEYRIELDETAQTFLVKAENKTVYESTVRADCVQFITDHTTPSEWRYYIIPDLNTWAANSADQTPIEYYLTFEEAKARFDELRPQAYNQETMLNRSGLPSARLTLGIDRLDKPSATDILHVRDGKNVMVTDFVRQNDLNTDAVVLDMISETAQKIGYEQVQDYPLQPDGNYASKPVILDFTEWSKTQPYLKLSAEPLPVYPFPYTYAKEHGELEQYQASRTANIACKDAIEQSIHDNFDGMRLNHDAAKDVITSFGKERVAYVLATTVQLLEHDGRFSPRNKSWAHTIDSQPDNNVFDEDRRSSFRVDSHPAVLDGFIHLFRQETEPKQEQAVRKQPEKFHDALSSRLSDRISAAKKIAQTQNTGNSHEFQSRKEPQV
ncbi:DUF3849 domain-containing protein [Butyricicoccus porcorum]|uniref:DUF3849 domain-containing protein n=1 Tax=Butyricicoccus porcorum TaxID=1945634 RepID=UPI003F4AAE75